MHALHTQFDMLAIQSSWQAFDTMAHLRPIHDEENYDRMTKLMNSLLDAAGVDEDHSLSGLLDLVGDLVSMYEQSHHAIEPAEPRDALRFLMDARGLKQDDLSSFVPPKAICRQSWQESAKSVQPWQGDWASFLALAPLCLSRSELKNGKSEPQNERNPHETCCGE